MSCDEGDFGCGGGLISYALNFIQDHGVVADKDYPYVSG